MIGYLFAVATLVAVFACVIAHLFATLQIRT